MHDLSSDEKATPDTSETLTSHQLLLFERIITQVFSEYIISCIVDDEIHALFKAKLWCMGQKISKAGSISKKKTLAEWRSGAQSTWEIKLNPDNFKKALLKEKNRLEEKFQLEHCKHLETEQELYSSEVILKETQVATAVFTTGTKSNTS